MVGFALLSDDELVLEHAPYSSISIHPPFLVSLTLSPLTKCLLSSAAATAAW